MNHINIQIPPNWEPMGKDEYIKKVKLPPDHPEYIKTKENF